MNPKTDTLYLKRNLIMQLRVDEGICYGLYCSPTRGLMCGVGHSLESRPLPRSDLYKWLKQGMSPNEVETLLARDVVSIIKAVDQKYKPEVWYEKMTAGQCLGWYHLAHILGVTGLNRLGDTINAIQAGTPKGIRETLHNNARLLKLVDKLRVDRIASLLGYNVLPAYYRTETPEDIKPVLIKPVKRED